MVDQVSSKNQGGVKQINFANGTVWDATAIIRGTANNDTSLTGDANNNVIFGEMGNDIISGGTGSDTLNGGLGNDTYLFARGDGIDALIDIEYAANTDVLSFFNDISHDQLWFRKQGNGLEVSIVGTTDKVIVNNWYVGTNNHIE